MSTRITSFREFWPYYVAEHVNPLNRQLHFIGTSLVLLLALVFLASGRLLWLGLMPVAGYGFAWTGHFFFEKNRPATFRYPLFSLAADFVMYSCMWSGTMDAEVAKHRRTAE